MLRGTTAHLVHATGASVGQNPLLFVCARSGACTSQRAALHRSAARSDALALRWRTVPAMHNVMAPGVSSRAQLLQAGSTDRAIRRAVAAGELRRLRPGWYATPTADADVARAVASGGAASCITALAALGVWVPHDHRVHVRRTRRLRGELASGLVACDVPHARTTSVDQPIDGVLGALAAAAGCLTGEMLTVVIDSALHRGLTNRRELEGLWRHAPRRVRRALAAADGRAESGTETLVRVRLAARGIRFTPQVRIGDKRVDLLLGRLIIEVDSKAWHLDEEAYERDRARDRQLAALGYQVIRLTYAQVLQDWAAVEADLLATIAQGAHAPGA